MTTFGNLQIAATPRGGAIAPFEGAAVPYHWAWYWHLPSLGPWLLLALAVVVPSPNRHRQALLIFAPLLILGLLWGRVTAWTGMPSASRAQSSFLGEFLAVGLALLWLNAGMLGTLRGARRLAAHLGILGLAGLAAVLAFWGAFSGQTGIFVALTAIVALILLVSLTLTRWLAHHRYQPGRFLLWFAVWDTICSVAGAAVFVGVLALTVGYPLRNWNAVLLQIVMPGLVISVCLYAVNLPYSLLMFTSPFFRQRFQRWLGAEPASPQGAEAFRGSEGV